MFYTVEVQTLLTSPPTSRDLSLDSSCDHMCKLDTHCTFQGFFVAMSKGRKLITERLQTHGEASPGYLRCHLYLRMKALFKSLTFYSFHRIPSSPVPMNFSLICMPSVIITAGFLHSIVCNILLSQAMAAYLSCS